MVTLGLAHLDSYGLAVKRTHFYKVSESLGYIMAEQLNVCIVTWGLAMERIRFSKYLMMGNPKYYCFVCGGRWLGNAPSCSGLLLPSPPSKQIHGLPNK